MAQIIEIPVSAANRAVPVRPMRDILRRLPQLPMNANQQIDFPAADPAMLVAIAEDAEMLMSATYSGLGAVGQLLANSSVLIEDGTISADCIESLGWFQSEMADMAHHFMGLAVQCRHATAGYYPPGPKSPFVRIDPPPPRVATATLQSRPGMATAKPFK